MSAPFVELTDLIKFWMPWLTVGGLVWRGYRKAKTTVDTWAGTLLDNHLAHLQGSLTHIEELLQQLIDKE